MARLGTDGHLNRIEQPRTPIAFRGTVFGVVFDKAPGSKPRITSTLRSETATEDGRNTRMKTEMNRHRRTAAVPAAAATHYRGRPRPDKLIDGKMIQSISEP